MVDAGNNWTLERNAVQDRVGPHFVVPLPLLIFDYLKLSFCHPSYRNFFNVNLVVIDAELKKIWRLLIVLYAKVDYVRHVTELPVVEGTCYVGNLADFGYGITFEVNLRVQRIVLANIVEFLCVEVHLLLVFNLGQLSESWAPNK